MRIYPAIDLRNGQAVRLVQGDYNQMTVYGDNPAEVAKQFRAQGASNLHLVDLDGAKSGNPVNKPVIQAILQVPGLFVQVGGGLRTRARVDEFLSMGVNRVILGTAAIQNPAFAVEMVKAYGADAIAVGMDARNGKAATDGWLETSGEDSFTLCERLADRGIRTIIYTDISKDGLLSGTNLEAYARLSEIKDLNIIASGGITGMDELYKLSAMGIYGAIVGKALYTGHMDPKTLFARFKEETV